MVIQDKQHIPSLWQAPGDESLKIQTAGASLPASLEVCCQQTGAAQLQVPDVSAVVHVQSRELRQRQGN